MESILVGGSRLKLNAYILINLVFKVPSYFEQEKIGTILDYVDNLITLHQRKPPLPILLARKPNRTEKSSH